MPSASGSPTTHLFYETPHRILAALEDIVAVFGPAHTIVLARELTKLHEEFLRGPATEVLATLAARPTIRGEIVLLIDGSMQPTPAGAATLTLAAEVDALLRSGLTEKDALKQVARSRGLGKSEAYREYQRKRSR